MSHEALEQEVPETHCTSALRKPRSETFVNRQAGAFAYGDDEFRQVISLLPASRTCRCARNPIDEPSHVNVISRAKDGLAQAFRVSTAAPVLA